MREDAERYCETFKTDTRAYDYAVMVLQHRTGARKTLASPKGFELTSEDAEGVRDQIDHELRRHEPIVLAPSPLGFPLEDARGAPERFSVSFIGNASKCLMMANLERQHRVSGEWAIRGSLFHQVVRVLTMYALGEGRTGYDADEAEALASDIMQDPEHGGAIALSIYFDVIEMVKRWTKKVEFWPDAIPHVEELFTRPIEVNGRTETVSGKMDLVQVREGIVRVDDYKTGPHVPSQDEFERRIQTPMYAWLLAPIYQSAHTFDVGEVYVSPMLSEPIRRSVELHPADLGIDRFVHNTILNMREAYGRESFPAQPGSHCENCSRPSLCPIPPELRPDAALDTPEHARAAFAWVIATQAQMDRVRTALRGYVARTEQPVVVGDMIATYRSRARRVADETVIAAALEHEGLAEVAYRTTDFSTFVIEKVKEGDE